MTVVALKESGGHSDRLLRIAASDDHFALILHQSGTDPADSPFVNVQCGPSGWEITIHDARDHARPLSINLPDSGGVTFD
jgi:hypothetical protein